MNLTNEQRNQVRKQMREWLILTRGQKTKTERMKKWRELVRDILQDEKIRQEAAEKAKVTRARRKMLAKKFEAYR